MSAADEIHSCLKVSDISGALSCCKAAIRKAPTDAELRFMLFQLLGLQADWEGASNQLIAYSELTGRQSPLPIVLNNVIQTEVRRKYVFTGDEAPTVFGEPQEWIAYMVQAVSEAGKGNFEAAKTLHQQAAEKIHPLSGSINGQPFSWLMDGDSRLGFVMEAVINGKYYWVPQIRLRAIQMQAPEQVRDVIWAAATLSLDTGADISAFLPVRYPGAQSWSDARMKLARATDWETPVEDFYTGLGQRMWMTDTGEYPMLETREITFNPPA